MSWKDKTKNYYNSLSLFKKIFIPNLIGLLLLLGYGVLVFSTTIAVEKGTIVLQREITPMLNMAKENEISFEQIGEVFTFAKLTSDPMWIEETNKHAQIIRKNLHRLQQEDPSIGFEATEALSAFESYYRIMKEDVLSMKDTTILSTDSNKIYIAYTNTDKAFKQLQGTLENDLQNEFKSILSRMYFLNSNVLLLAVLLLILFSISTYLIHSDVRLRLQVLMANITNMSADDFKYQDRIEMIMGGEFGAIAKNINKVLERFEDDVSGLESEVEHYEELSNYDPLTKIFNRRYIDHSLQALHERFIQGETPYGVIMVDVDHFKQFNDLYGHSTGDAVLQKVADTIKENIRDTDVCGRFGGEEFIIIAKSDSEEKIVQIAEKIRKKLEELSIESAGQVTASFGIALIRHDMTVSDLIERADKALYKAKKTGRNKVVV